MNKLCISLESADTPPDETDDSLSMLESTVSMTGSSMTQAAIVLSSPDLDSPGSSIHVCFHERLPAPVQVSLPQCTCRPMPSSRDTLRSTGCDNDPVTAAAHLHLLGESLLLIGHYLQETDKLVCVSTSLSVLLDSLLCTLAPLMSLSSQIPELQGCLEHTVDPTLENVSYLMPGL